MTMEDKNTSDILAEKEEWETFRDTIEKVSEAIKVGLSLLSKPQPQINLIQFNKIWV